MDNLVFLIGLLGFLFGFLIAWLIAHRAEEKFWTKRLAELRRREMAYHALASEKVDAVQTKAQHEQEALRVELTRQMDAVRARAEERVGAAYAKAETMMASLAREYESRQAAPLQAYRHGLAAIRASTPIGSAVSLPAESPTDAAVGAESDSAE